MFLTAKKIPYSSIVGQSVALLDEKGAVVCQLAIMNVQKGLDPKKISDDIATLICLHFNEAGA